MLQNFARLMIQFKRWRLFRNKQLFPSSNRQTHSSITYTLHIFTFSHFPHVSPFLFISMTFPNDCSFWTLNLQFWTIENRIIFMNFSVLNWKHIFYINGVCMFVYLPFPNPNAVHPIAILTRSGRMRIGLTSWLAVCRRKTEVVKSIIIIISTTEYEEGGMPAEASPAQVEVVEEKKYHKSLWDVKMIVKDMKKTIFSIA